MGAQSTVAKWGASLAVRIPKAIAEQWGVREGSAVELVSRGEQVVMRKKKYDLTEMLAKVSPENLHSEVDSGPPAGREEWWGSLVSRMWGTWSGFPFLHRRDTKCRGGGQPSCSVPKCTTPGLVWRYAAQSLPG